MVFSSGSCCLLLGGLAEAELTVLRKLGHFLSTAWQASFLGHAQPLTNLTSLEHRAVFSDHTSVPTPTPIPRPPSLALLDTWLCSHKGLDRMSLTTTQIPPLPTIHAIPREAVSQVCWLQADPAAPAHADLCDVVR